MPGHTIAEKILAAKSGRTSVRPGEIVDAYPDLVMSHTATWRSVSVMQKVGATKLYDPDRLAVVLARDGARCVWCGRDVATGLVAETSLSSWLDWLITCISTGALPPVGYTAAPWGAAPKVIWASRIAMPFAVTVAPVALLAW